MSEQEQVWPFVDPGASGVFRALVAANDDGKLIQEYLQSVYDVNRIRVEDHKAAYESMYKALVVMAVAMQSLREDHPGLEPKIAFLASIDWDKELGGTDG